MDQLQDEDGLAVDGTRHNVVNNQVCVVTWKGSGTEVTGLSDIGKAKSIALADGSVPVGKYTRQAMVNAGMLDKVDDVSQITTSEIQEALGGVEINECANVGAVTAAVAEGSNEVGSDFPLLLYPSKNREMDFSMFVNQIRNDACLSKEEWNDVMGNNLRRILDI